MKLNCRICNNSENNISYIFREMFFGTRELFPYFQCSNCGCIQIQSQPEEMSNYYPGNYYSFGSVDEPAQKERGMKERSKEYLTLVRDRYNLLGKSAPGFLIEKIKPNDEKKIESLKILKLETSLKILDVGCGGGEFLYQLKQIGFKNLSGIDPYLKKDITYQNGLTIFRKSLEELVNDTVKFDLIMFHHVFEHLNDPLKVLILCNKIMKDDGILILRVPVSDSYAWNKYKENWIQLDAPRHFYIHSKKSLCILAEKSGFECFKIIFDSDEFQFWGSEQYKKEIALKAENSYLMNPAKSIFSEEKIKEFKKSAIELNANREGDQIVIYLGKDKNLKEKWFR